MAHQISVLKPPNVEPDTRPFQEVLATFWQNRNPRNWSIETELLVHPANYFSIKAAIKFSWAIEIRYAISTGHSGVYAAPASVEWMEQQAIRAAISYLPSLEKANP